MTSSHNLKNTADRHGSRRGCIELGTKRCEIRDDDDELTRLHAVLEYRMVFFVTVFALPEVVHIESRAFEVVSKAVEEIHFVVVDIVRAALLLVQDHSLPR